MRSYCISVLLVALLTVPFCKTTTDREAAGVTAVPGKALSKDSIVFNLYVEDKSTPALSYFDVFNQQHFIIRPDETPEKQSRIIRRAIYSTEPIFVEYMVLPRHLMVYLKPGDVIDVHFQTKGGATFNYTEQTDNIDVFSGLSKNNESLLEFQWSNAIAKLDKKRQRMLLAIQRVKADSVLDGMNDTKQMLPENYIAYKKLVQFLFLTSEIELATGTAETFSTDEQALIDQNLRLNGWDKIVSYRQFVYAYYIFICKKKERVTPLQKFNYVASLPAINARNYMLLLALLEIRKKESSQFDDYREKFYSLCKDTNYINYVQINLKDIPLSNSTAMLVSSSDTYPPIPFKTWLSQHKGNVVYLDFWASWCSPCRKEMPNSHELKKVFAGKKVVFAYLSIDKVMSDWLSANKDEHLSTDPNSFLLRGENKDPLLSRIDLSTIPRYALFNKAGQLVETDADRPGSAGIRAVISKMLVE